MTVVATKTRQNLIYDYAAERPVSVVLEASLPEKDRKRGRLARLTYEFSAMDTINSNRRVYPAGVMRDALEVLDAECQRGKVYGANDHPAWSEYLGLDGLQVKLADASTRIVSCEAIDAKRIRVIQDVLDNDHGRQLVSCFEAGGQPGISQRAMALFEPATDAEKVKYGAQPEDDVVVARHLRLITFDNVARPGFADAIGAGVTEHDRGANAMKPTAEQIAAFKNQHPDMIAAIVASEGAATAVQGELAKVQHEASEAKKQIESLDAEKQKLAGDNKALREALEGIKPILVKLGIVNEQITDAEARAKVTALESEVAGLKAKVAAGDEALKKAAARADEAERAGRIATATKAVREKYAKESEADLGLILKACEGIDDAAKALEAAGAKAAEIKQIRMSVASPGGGRATRANEQVTEPDADGANEAAAVLGALYGGQ